MIEKVLIEGIEFPLNPETDAFIDGHVYCKECGEQLDLEPINLLGNYSGTLVKTKIDKFLNVSGSRHCSIEQQCREVALCWRDVPDG